MDEKSTPISSLNNKVDESEVVNQILSKYNNLQDGNVNPSITEMENKFEDRNLNQEVYEINSKNIAYDDHYKGELQRTAQYQNNQSNQNNKNIAEDDDDEYEDEYEYEVVEIPLWKRVINEIRIPIFIFILILIFNNCLFDKYLVKKIAFLGNQFNECNTYGFLFKAFLISIFSYFFIRFIRL